MRNDQVYLFHKDGLGSPAGVGRPPWWDSVWTDDEELSVGPCFGLSKVDQNKIMSPRLLFSPVFVA